MFQPNVYFETTPPAWLWLDGVRRGQQVWNETCAGCCPCCNASSPSNLAELDGYEQFQCGSLGDGGDAVDGAWTNWDAIPEVTQGLTGVGAHVVARHPMPSR